MKKVFMGAGIAVIALLVLVGGAFAAYNFWQGQANVTVLEGMTVVKTADTGGTWDAGTSTWTITALKPGESRSITFAVSNTASSGVLKITPMVTPASYPGFGLGWSDFPADGLVNAGETKTATFTIIAGGDVTPGSSYVFILNFTRESPAP